ncbi:MAG: M20/M25/M40 family metallo-hydrolase [Planctomycetota bacterium]|nr:M20/M25/M40 family metallo-hydrolase [Planctomycetota bacterium]
MRIFLLTCTLGLGFCLMTFSCSSVTFQEDVAKVAGNASEARLTQHLVALTGMGPRRAGDPEIGVRTVEYLERELHALGVETEREVFTCTPEVKLSFQRGEEEIEIPGNFFSQTISQSRVLSGFEGSAVFTTGDNQPVQQINLLATIPGTKNPNRILEISAHHDTVPGTVGADDNTSGVMVLLELARLLQQHRPEYTVRLCFFAAEEIGLRGSYEHVRRMLDSGEVNQVFGLINMDTVGFYTEEEDSQESPARIPFLVWPPSTGNFLGIIGGHGSASLAHLVEDAGSVYVNDLPTYTLARLGAFLPDARRSDHAPYWDVEIPAVFLTDTAEFRTDTYHRPSDNVESVNLEALRKVTALVFSAAVSASELAN